MCPVLLKAGTMNSTRLFRLRDFITMGELMAYDALNRNESCGGHFREEYQTGRR